MQDQCLPAAKIAWPRNRHTDIRDPLIELTQPPPPPRASLEADCASLQKQLDAQSRTSAKASWEAQERYAALVERACDLQAKLDDTQAKLAASEADRAQLNTTIATLTDEGARRRQLAWLKDAIEAGILLDACL
jgi:septal ring factor EnvC (AmiA/AmiB activator)